MCCAHITFSTAICCMCRVMCFGTRQVKAATQFLRCTTSGMGLQHDAGMLRDCIDEFVAFASTVHTYFPGLRIEVLRSTCSNERGSLMIAVWCVAGPCRGRVQAAVATPYVPQNFQICCWFMSSTRAWGSCHYTCAAELSDVLLVHVKDVCKQQWPARRDLPEDAAASASTSRESKQTC